MKGEVIVTLNLALLLLLGSCASPGHEPAQDNSTHNHPEPADDLCDAVEDYDIFGLTAVLWKDAWKTVIADDHGVPTNTLTDKQLYREFFEDDMEAFLSTGSFEHLRIYFAQKDPSIPSLGNVPDLIMVKASDCIDYTNTSALLACWDEASDKDTTIELDSTDAKTYIQNWKNNKTYGDPFAGIISYTFTKATIQNLLTSNQSEVTQDLRFYFGVHVDPEIEPSAPTQGKLMLDIISGIGEGPDPNSTIYADLARPCPKLCAPASPYYKSATN